MAVFWAVNMMFPPCQVRFGELLVVAVWPGASPLAHWILAIGGSACPCPDWISSANNTTDSNVINTANVNTKKTTRFFILTPQKSCGNAKDRGHYTHVS